MNVDASEAYSPNFELKKKFDSIPFSETFSAEGISSIQALEQNKQLQEQKDQSLVMPEKVNQDL